MAGAAIRPADETLRRALGWAIPAMAAGWGTPLDDEQSAVLEPFLAQGEPSPDDWEDTFHELLQQVANAPD